MGDTGSMSATDDPAGTPRAVWTAAAVARRLGVAPGTLRSWTQRYGIGPAAHTPGRHRRYTAADVAELDAVRGLVDQGVALSAAVEIVRSQRRTGTRAGRADPVAPARTPGTVADLVAAASRLDAESGIEIVTAALDRDGVLVAWDELCRPALTGLDAAVAGDRGCVDAHLLLSWVLTTCLRPRGALRGPGPVLLACTAGEQHTLGLEVLHAALAERRVPARMLGASVPRPALTHAAAQLQPRAVVLWAHRPTTARPEVLGGLREHCDTVLAAGPGWPSELPTAVGRVDSLPAALALTTVAVTAPLPS